MKRSAHWWMSLWLAALLPMHAVAQDKVKAEQKAKSDDKAADEQRAKQEPILTTPVRLQIVFSESEGGKVTKSLPYALYLNAPNTPDLRPGTWSKLRIGSRVPVHTDADKIQYLDIGTNIDARAANIGQGYFLAALSLERSWVDQEGATPATGPAGSGSDAVAGGRFRDPIIRTARTELDLKVKDAQSLETTMATDPLSGKVLRIEVTLSSVK